MRLMWGATRVRRGARRPGGAVRRGGGDAMVVAVLTAGFALPQASTLKDKRSVVQSMLERVGRRFRASAAEVGWQDTPSRTLVALAVVSSTGRHADRVLQAALEFMEEDYPVELISAEVEHR